MKKIFTCLTCFLLSFCLHAFPQDPQKYYIEPVDSFTLGHGRFVVGHYSIARHMPGKVLFLRTIRASKSGIYYLSRDILDIKDVSSLYNAIPERPATMPDTEWREIYSQVFDLPNVEEVDEEEFKNKDCQ